MSKPKVQKEKLLICTAILTAPKAVIPAKAGIQENTGFRVKPGMTTYTGLMSFEH
jgi:hypothetical protein